MGKIKLQKIVDKLRKLHEWNGHLEIQIIVDKLQKLHEWNGHLEINSRQFLLSPNRYFTETVIGCPRQYPSLMQFYFNISSSIAVIVIPKLIILYKIRIKRCRV